jgi:hypothetical protein
VPGVTGWPILTWHAAVNATHAHESKRTHARPNGRGSFWIFGVNPIAAKDLPNITTRNDQITPPSKKFFAPQAIHPRFISRFHPGDGIRSRSRHRVPHSHGSRRSSFGAPGKIKTEAVMIFQKKRNRGVNPRLAFCSQIPGSCLITRSASSVVSIGVPVAVLERPVAPIQPSSWGPWGVASFTGALLWTHHPLATLFGRSTGCGDIRGTVLRSPCREAGLRTARRVDRAVNSSTRSGCSPIIRLMGSDAMDFSTADCAEVIRGRQS